MPCVLFPPIERSYVLIITTEWQNIFVEIEMTTMTTRDIGRVVRTPPPAPGFIGEGHTAVEVVNPADFPRNDPFIVLMDDRVDLPPGGRGEAHIRTPDSRSRHFSSKANCATATRACSARAT